MSPSELLEISQLAWANGIGTYAIFLTISGGYLVAAYSAGRSLTRAQYLLANGLFLVLATSTVLAVTAFFTAALRHADRAARLDPEFAQLASPYAIAAVTAVNLFVVVACLKFMRDVRTPGAE